MKKTGDENACMVEQMEEDLTRKHGIAENELDETVEDGVSSNFDSFNGLLDFKCIVPVTKITVTNEITRDNIAQRFILNKNQKAAFMIITGHLDGLDKLNEGIIIKPINKLTISPYVTL